MLVDEKEARAKRSHGSIKCSEAGNRRRSLTNCCARFSRNLCRPPSEQLDNLITWLGTHGRAGTRVDADPSAVSAIGAIDYGGFAFIAGDALKRGLIDCSVRNMKVLGPQGDQFQVTPMQLTLAGWDRLEDLRRARPGSRIAFMAMPFGKPDLDALYFGHFLIAVKATGFTLKRLDEDQLAGLIDDRLRVETRQCRFLLADLTHGNPGAYWEGGYAEGLDKPVIYTCEKSVFEDRTKGTHFDTNHHLTVVWDAASPAAGVIKLKATMATLPAEALLSD